MKKRDVILSGVALAAVVGALVLLLAGGKPADITVVTAPSQTEPLVPEWARLPEAPHIDFGENIALGILPSTSGFADVYRPQGATDGDEYTYWEGNGFPSDLTLDFGQAYPIGHLVFRLNPGAIWAARTQTVQVDASADGQTWQTLVKSTDLGFDPAAANVAVLSIEAIDGTLPRAQFLRVTFLANTGASGGQVAELEVYTE